MSTSGQNTTCIAHVKRDGHERLRARMTLSWRRAGVEEAAETRAHLPNKNHTLVQRYCYQSPPIGGEVAGGRSRLVSFQHVQTRRGLEVVHHYRAFTGAHREPLTLHVEVNVWKPKDWWKDR